MDSKGRARGGGRGAEPGPPIEVGTGKGKETRPVPELPVDASWVRDGICLGVSFWSLFSDPPEFEAAAS